MYICIIFNPQNTFDGGKYYYYSHFAEKEIEAQRAYIIWPGSQSGRGSV